MSKKREVEKRVMENESNITLPKPIQAKKDLVFGLLEVLGLEEYDCKRLAINVTNLLLEKSVEEEEDELIKNLRRAKEEREEETIDLLDGSKKHLTKKELKKLRRADKKRKLQYSLEGGGISEIKESEENMGEEPEDENDIENTPKGKETNKRGSHLIPREKIEYPKELLKHPKLGKFLQMHENGGDEGRKGRMGMRKLGFKLSDKETWTPFLKGMSKKNKK